MLGYWEVTLRISPVHELWHWVTSAYCLEEEEKVTVKVLVTSVVSDFETLGTIACLAPLPNATLQTRILEWVAVPFSRGSSQLRDWTWVTHNAGRFFTV